MTQAMVNKILHTPTVRLKSQATDGACGLYIDALKELFDLTKEKILRELIIGTRGALLLCGRPDGLLTR